MPTEFLIILPLALSMIRDVAESINLHVVAITFVLVALSLWTVKRWNKRDTYEKRASFLPKRAECTELDLPCTINLTIMKSRRKRGFYTVFFNGYNMGKLKSGGSLDFKTEHAENDVVIWYNKDMMQHEYSFLAPSGGKSNISFNPMDFTFVDST